MPTPHMLEILDICVPLFFVSLYSLGKMQKESFKLIFRIWIVGLLFGLSWEPWGTGLVWQYPNYSFYFYDGIPLAIPFGWAWWFIVCYGIWQLLMRAKGNNEKASILLYYLSGVLFATLLETVAAIMNWWKFTYAPWFSRPWPLVFVINGSPVHILIFLSWGIIALHSFLIAIPIFEKFKKRWGEKVSYSLLVPSTVVTSTVLWLILRLLTWITETVLLL